MSKELIKIGVLGEKLLESGYFLLLVGVLMLLLFNIFYLIEYWISYLSFGYIKPVLSGDFDVIALFGFKINGVPVVFIIWSWGFILVFAGFAVKFIEDTLKILLKGV